MAITSQFLPDGPAFWEEDADGTQRSVDVIGGGRATDPEIEIVVLVNDGSASASEILAGALQDADRANRNCRHPHCHVVAQLQGTTCIDNRQL